MLLEKFYYLENRTKYFEMACVETHETFVSIERKKRVNRQPLIEQLQWKRVVAYMDQVR